MKKKIKDLYAALQEKIDSSKMLWNEPIKEYTTFKIGGPADLLLLPENIEEISYICQKTNEYGISPLILGGGSNVLVLDGGIRNVVICLANFKGELRQDGSKILVSAGITLKELSYFALKCHLSGLEFAVGIPGTVGGAVFMNAGAYGGEIKEVVTAVETIDLQGNLHRYNVEDCNFNYRQSLFQHNGEIIIGAEFDLISGNSDNIKTIMDELTEKRESKQPLEYASAGSTFKRPPGYFAGTLIEQTGLKGLSVGEAEVSTKHAGFVINKGEATAADVLAVIKKVQEAIKDAHGIDLETEVRILGEHFSE